MNKDRKLDVERVSKSSVNIQETTWDAEKIYERVKKEEMKDWEKSKYRITRSGVL